MSAREGRAPVAVLVNPLAGSAPLDAGGLAEALGNRGFVRQAKTAAELESFAAEVEREGVEVVCVCGGDGTLGRCATALEARSFVRRKPALAPIGGGTMNTIARSLGLRRQPPVRALRAVLDREERSRRSTRTTMRINGSRLGFMFGAGVPARFLRLYEQGARLGAWRAARVLGELVASALVGGKAVRDLFAEVPGRVAVDGRELELNALSLVYAAVIDDIGLGFKPTPMAPGAVGRFEVLIGAARPLDLVRALPRIRFGDGIGGDPWVDLCAERVSIRLDDGIAYMIDGDVEPETATLDVEVGVAFEIVIADGAD